MIRTVQSELWVSTSAAMEVGIVRAIIACPVPRKVVILGRIGLPWAEHPAALAELRAYFAARPSVDGDGLFAIGSLTPYRRGAWFIHSLILDERRVYYGPFCLPEWGPYLGIWDESPGAVPKLRAVYSEGLAYYPYIRPEDYGACPACQRWVTPDELVLQDGDVRCQGCTDVDEDMLNEGAEAPEESVSV
jgi:hypothetical protein